jgi:hypothetical protein
MQSGSGMPRGVSEDYDPFKPKVESVSKQEILDVKERFDLLYRQFDDLSKSCNIYVSRTEIEEAMLAVLQEVKKVKTQTVDKVVVDKLIEKKTDKAEFEKMVEALSGSLENLKEYVDTLKLANTRIGAALRSKCLVCDKTIDPVAALAELEENTRLLSSKRNRLKSVHRPVRGVSVGYNKSEDPLTYLDRPHTSMPTLSRSTTSFPNNQLIDYETKVHMIDGLNSESVQRSVVELIPLEKQPPSPNNSPTKKASFTIPDSAAVSKHLGRVKGAVGGGVHLKKSTDNTR